MKEETRDQATTRYLQAGGQAKDYIKKGKDDVAPGMQWCLICQTPVDEQGNGNHLAYCPFEADEKPL